MPYYGLSRGKVVRIPLKGQFERIYVSPDVSLSISVPKHTHTDTHTHTHK